MNNNIYVFVEKVVDLFAYWLFSDKKEWAWCPIVVDIREERY